MKINGAGLSPCFGCGKKNFAAGCHCGCREMDDWLAARERSRRARALDAAAGEFLADGTARRNGKRRPMR